MDSNVPMRLVLKMQRLGLTSPAKFRRLMILAFLPVEEVVPSFVSLLEHIPDGLELDDFLDYFESTWIQGVSTSRRSGSARYPPSSWNCVERTMTSINRTNAVPEVFNRECAAKAGQANPTIWNYGTSWLPCMWSNQTQTVRC